jgi:hypothetical protein
LGTLDVCSRRYVSPSGNQKCNIKWSRAFGHGKGNWIILDANPLDDIRNTEKIKYVIINGRVYDSATMNETISREKSRNLFWWQMNRSESFTIPQGNVETYLYTHPKCD